ncbi:hypothetical protein J6590_068039 [Homalodisca vitripennis]|nr:hypothetical protein J6590_068039 [Homalodisca vitripennis]
MSETVFVLLSRDEQIKHPSMFAPGVGEQAEPRRDVKLVGVFDGGKNKQSFKGYDLQDSVYDQQCYRGCALFPEEIGDKSHCYLLCAKDSLSPPDI